MLRSLQRILLTVLLMQAATWVVAAPAAAPELEARVIEFARETLLEQAQRDGLIDPQLQLQVLPGKARAVAPACPGGWQVQVLDARFLSRLRYGAQCAASGVSTELMLRAQLSAEVLVTARAVSSGQTLSTEDMLLQRRDITSTPDALSQVEALQGLSPRSSLRVGQLVQKRQLQAALLVRRGDKLRIVARQAGVEVHANGEALEAGARDALIKVRNSSSGRTITARVLDTGLVEPTGP